MVSKPRVMPYESIPWAHWGIHTIDAYNPENALKISKKVWDPLSSTYIQLSPHNGDHAILNKLYGRYSLISAIRGARPVETQPSSNDITEEVFAPIIEGRDYGIVIAKGSSFNDTPFSIQPKLEDISSEIAATIINRFGSYARYVDPEIEADIKNQLSGNAKIAHGINLVTIPTQYVERVEEACVKTLASMLDSSRSSLRFIAEEARGRGIRLVPYNIFFNIGPEAGGTLKRLHSQGYVDLNEDGHGNTLESLLKASENHSLNGGCTLCNHYLNDYKITENSEASMYAAPSPIRNYEILISPKRHFEDLTLANYGELEAVAEMLIKASSGLNELKVHPSRNILIYQRPFGYNSNFHVLIRILPFEYVGGQEMMDDSRVARIDPLNVAAEMKSIIAAMPEPALSH